MRRIVRWLDDSFEEFFLVIFLVLITLTMGIQVVARLMGNALSWSEELARFLFVWSGFLSISYCFKRQASIKIEQVVELLPARVNALVKIIEKMILLTFYLIMLQYAWDYLGRSIASGQLSPAMQIPMYLIQVAPLVGFVLSIIRLVQGVFEKCQLLVTGREPDSAASGAGETDYQEVVS